MAGNRTKNAGNTIDFSGTFLLPKTGLLASDTKLYLGTHEINYASGATTTSISFTMPALDYGNYTAKLYIANYGYA